MVRNDAYVAGLFDGEGTIATPGSGSPILAIVNTHLPTLRWVETNYGGGIREHKSNGFKENGKTVYKWETRNYSTTKEFTEAILPYVKIRKADILAVLTMLKENRKAG